MVLPPSLDLRLFRWLHAGESPDPVFLAVVQWLGSDFATLAAVAAVAWVLLGRGDARPAWCRAWLSVVLSWLVVFVLHAEWPAPRPFALGLGTAWIPHGNRPGWPSHHATLLFAMGSSLALSRQWVWGAGYVLAGGLVGTCRIVLGVHFPSDILTGLPVGLLVAMVTHLSWRFAEGVRQAVEPAVFARARRPVQPSAG